MRVTKAVREQQIAILEETYRGVKPALKFRNPFELLIAVILSAQCTDVRVNVVTERLFAKAPTPEAIIGMGLGALEEEIRDCGLFRNKAKNIMAACQLLLQEYGGQVPEDFEALQKLPGVGRKTANVVMSVAFGYPAIAVDTHVFRVANRLKLAAGSTPLEVEKGLQKSIPREKWSAAHHWLIWHGRKLCKARSPLCGECPLQQVCPSCEALQGPGK
ncbi:MAG: endonuclease III [Selenomonas ruminantium]|nr:endonuclease III [Selenomonas ruminantium]